MTATTYGLRIDAGEVARYRMMARRARERETELWARAGLGPGARVADVGCGPGAMVAALAELVGPTGSVVGVDADDQAVRLAAALLAAGGATNAEVRLGLADDTGLHPGTFDTVVMRHVLAHNGGREQRIIEHLSRLARPGGHVYLLDVDLTGVSVEPGTRDLDELHATYLRWHSDQGNDPRIGRRLARLARAAGLEVEEFRGWFEIAEQPPGMRGPAWAAQEELVRASLADPAALARWDAAFDRIDAGADRPEFMLPVFVAVARRPDREPVAS